MLEVDVRAGMQRAQAIAARRQVDAARCRFSPGASRSCTATCGVAIGPERQKPPAISGRTDGAGAKESSTLRSKSRS